MKIYVYWPFLRQEEFALLTSWPRADDELIVHTMRRAGAPSGRHGNVEVLDDLADVSSARVGSPRWLASRTLTYVTRARQREQAIQRLQPDVAHVVYQNLFTDALVLRRLRAMTALVSSVHDVWPHNRRLPRFVTKPLLRRVYATCGEIVVLHEALRRLLIADFDVNPERVHLLPHQVPRFRDEPRVLSAAPRALFFGTLRGNKGIDTLLNAAPAITAAGVGITIAGRGDADLESRVRATAAQLDGLDAEVGWVSPERKHELFSAADVVVLPYTSFASESGVLNDAYGHFLPVVVTDAASLGANVRAHGSGDVVPIDDAPALAAAVVAAVKDPQRWAERSAASRARAEANRPEVMATKLARVYELARDRRITTV